MKVLLVGVCSEERYVPIFNKLSNSQASISIAAIKYSRNIFEGFKHHINEDCVGVFLVPIGMYPITKICFFKSRTIKGVYYLPFVNIIILKQATIAASLLFFAVKWCFANRKSKKVIVFTCIYLPFLLPFVFLKHLAKLKLASFVPDLPEYEFSYAKSELSFKRILVSIYIPLTKLLCRFLDFFAFVSDAMKTKFESKPYCIVEGFVNSDCHDFKSKNFVSIGQKKSIMYAGALLEKFGINNLLKAFLLIPDDYELWIFGSGEMETEIRLTADKDKRIKFHGNISNKEVIKFERNATILINPRFTSNEFTRYSFPSKILEYMASGRPVLTTRLESIPCDYYDKLYFINDESVIGMRDAIVLCLQKSEQELSMFGSNARNYVLLEKNNVVQIADVIHKLKYL